MSGPLTTWRAKGQTLTALRQRETLTSQLSKALRERIDSGELKPGDKLPSEQELVERYGVSRTVVREAISSLRASGFVATQQGVGAFVLQRSGWPVLPAGETNPDVLQEIVRVLELRIALEVEAAALAAQRRKPEHIEHMRGALDQMAEMIEASEDAIAPDLRFHHAVAEATGNAHFTHLFSYLGALLIPRARVPTFRFYAADPVEYLLRVNHEHEEIYRAIHRQDSDAARSAMRLHLSNSRERLRGGLENPSKTDD
jgi:GntR family transcriptional regulator, transcriptional repressor for pyruvate dehydrogenase complex